MNDYKNANKRENLWKEVALEVGQIKTNGKRIIFILLGYQV